VERLSFTKLGDREYLPDHRKTKTTGRKWENESSGRCALKKRKPTPRTIQMKMCEKGEEWPRG